MISVLIGVNTNEFKNDLEDSIELEKGELICPECKGNGLITYYDSNKNKSNVKTICNKCKGKRKLDWIENIIGVQNYYPPDAYCVLYDI